MKNNYNSNSEKTMMDTEEKKKYLRGYQKALFKVRETEEALISFEEGSKYPSMMFNYTPKSEGGKSDLANLMVKMEMLERENMKERENALMKAEEIKNCINQLECDLEKRILTLRYIEPMKWDDICEEVSYSWRHVHSIHRRALTKLEIK